MRYFWAILIFSSSFLWAETISIDHFRANVFSKAEKKPVDVNLSIVVEGADVKKNEHKVIDTLNIVIGSYYSEDLVTSRGKELLKATMVAYAKKTHNLVIDSVFIKELVVKTTPSTQEIVEALKKEGAFQQPVMSQPKQQTPQIPQINLAPPLPKRTLIPEENSVNF